MKNAHYIIWNLIILISILVSSFEVLGQTDLVLKQHLINGVSSFENNMNEDAANSFSNGSTLNDYEDIAAYNLGRSLMETEDLEGATSAFMQAISSSENNDLISNAWYNSGNIALNSDDPATAIEAYKSSLRLNPNFSDARHNLAIANKMLQQQQEQEDQEQEDGDEENEDEQEGDEENEDEKEGDEENEDEQEGDEEKEDEQEGDEEKEDEQEGDEEKEDEQKKEDEQGKEDEPEEQVAGQISKEEMARILESLDQEEERILSKLRLKKGDGKKKTIEKPW